MDLARYAVDAVMLEGRSLRSVAGSLGMSKSWVADQVSLFRAGGYDNLAKRSMAAHSHPRQTASSMEDEIVYCENNWWNKAWMPEPRPLAITCPSVMS
jgi:transposase